MTGKFSEPDPARCNHYARFMKHLSLVEANVIFFTLFVVVLVLLCICSNIHHRSAGLKDCEIGNTTTDEQSSSQQFQVRQRRKGYMIIVSICFLMSLVCVLMEAFAALSIEYCSGEDLSMIYWSLWTTTQLGTVIAEFGVILHIIIVLYELDTPSWAVALGTPVLVFAAVGHIWERTLRRVWKKQRLPTEETQRGREKSVAMSRVSTVCDESALASRDTSPSKLNIEDVSKVIISMNQNIPVPSDQNIVVTIQTSEGIFQTEGKLVSL